MLLSFCIITTGQKPEETKKCIRSIHQNFSDQKIYEIILIGNNISQFKDCGVTLIEENEFIKFLGKRKNIGIEKSSGDIIVHCDDDILFPHNWFENFNKFREKNNNWEILGNKILLPDGKRYWDRCIYLPIHVMVDYDFECEESTFYQGGCFSICKRTLFDKIRWDETIPYYAIFHGFKYNEDVEFSLRLKEANIKIHFDKHNHVWHNDFTYVSNNLVCNKNFSKNIIELKCLDFIIESNIV